MYKFVSVIVPCRNEEKFIGNFIESLLNQDYPKENLEIIIVDGESNDKTKDIINKYQENNPNIKLFNNPYKTTPYALNQGILNSKGEVIVRMDVHSEYPKDYISKLVYYLYSLDADNVGGVCLTKPINNTLTAQAIALALSSPYGVGNAYFRIGASRIKEVDTVPFGVFKKEIFDKLGLFDIELTKNQDDEFNARIIKNKGKIFLIPEVQIIYYPRASFKELWQMYYNYGYFKPLVNKKIGKVTSIRQLIPPIFILSLIFSLFLSLYIFLGILTLYLLVNIFISLAISLKKNIKLFFHLIISFFIIHFSYGIGYIKGVIKWFIKK